jgi:DNA-binding Lrp family transcriptional regulator
VKDLSLDAGITPITFSHRVRQLRQDNILLSISAQLGYSILGLDSILLFLEVPFKNIEIVERSLDAHPYSRYRVRCLGDTNGIYAVMAIPQGSISMLLKFCDELRRMGLIHRYRYEYSVATWSHTETDFKYYDLPTDSWNFDWVNWMKGFTREPLPLPSYSVALARLDVRDMRILRQLTKDARGKKKDIAERAGVPNYVLTRRRQFYERSGVISCYRVVVHRNASRLFSTLLFECICPIGVTETFAEAIKRLPFQSTLVPIKDGFILQTALPSIDLPRLGRILQRYCDEVHVTWSDYDSSMRYWFWDVPLQDGVWLASKEFMVTDVIEEVLEQAPNSTYSFIYSSKKNLI